MMNLKKFSRLGKIVDFLIVLTNTIFPYVGRGRRVLVTRPSVEGRPVECLGRLKRIITTLTIQFLNLAGI